MIHKLIRLISALLKVNANPTDEQFHALADAAGIDHEALERVAYAMLALKLERDDQDADPGCLVDESTQVDDVELPQSLEEIRPSANPLMLSAAYTRTIAEAVKELSDADIANDGIDEYVLPYYDAAIPEGSRNVQQTVQVQEDTANDGGFKPFNQEVLQDDGIISPEVVRLVGTAVLQASVGVTELENAALVVQGVIKHGLHTESKVPPAKPGADTATVVLQKPLSPHDVEEMLDRFLPSVTLLREEVKGGDGYTVLTGDINQKMWTIQLQVEDRLVTQILIQP